MIKEAYVSYEVARLLKEKGFDEKVLTYYEEDVLCLCYGDWFEWNRSPLGHIAAPTQQMAMKWLREEHNFHITIMFSKYLYGDYPFYYWSIDKMVDGKREHTSTATADYTFKSYEEAVEAALKYALENLI